MAVWGGVAVLRLLPCDSDDDDGCGDGDADDDGGDDADGYV